MRGPLLKKQNNPLKMDHYTAVGDLHPDLEGVL
jgi:hypothetical protein